MVYDSSDRSLGTMCSSYCFSNLAEAWMDSTLHLGHAIVFETGIGKTWTIFFVPTARSGNSGLNFVQTNLFPFSLNPYFVKRTRNYACLYSLYCNSAFTFSDKRAKKKLYRYKVVFHKGISPNAPSIVPQEPGPRWSAHSNVPLVRFN